MQVIRPFPRVPSLAVQRSRSGLAAEADPGAGCGPAAEDEEGCVPCRLARETHSPEQGPEALTRRVASGAALFRQGDRLQCLYAVRRGTFMLAMTTPAGREQVTAFRMQGELLGLDALSDDRHATSAIALQDAEVFPVALDALHELLAGDAALATGFRRLLGREMLRDQRRLLLLGTLGAEERVAAFLLNLSARSAESGGDATAVALPMTRSDIGNYLGLRLETVSRILHRFEKRGWLHLHRGGVTALRIDALKAFFPPGPKAAR